MNIKNIHVWDVNPKEAILIQKLLAKDIIKEGKHTNIRYVAGCDVSFMRGVKQGYAVIVVLSYPELEIIEVSNFVGDPPMPYVPGLLSFREAPLLIETFKKLKTIPDIVIYDGQGYAHPRRIGLATHMGIITDLPSIGCAKSLLIGDYEPQQSEKGNYTELTLKNELIGYVLYTKTKCNPLFISIGHKVSIEFARDFTLSCVKNYKMPEPTRQAHIYSNKLRKEHNTT
jgi:deoxyribonuclease V